MQGAFCKFFNLIIRPDAYMERKKLMFALVLLKQFNSYFPTSIIILLTIHASHTNASGLMDDANAVVYT